MTTILIVDDHPLSREGTTAALRELPAAPAVLQAGTLDEAFAAMLARTVQVMLLDLDLGPTRGIATLRSARAWLDSQSLDTRILVLSGLNDPALVNQALAHEAVGFIPKAAPREVLQQAVTRTLAGGIFLPHTLGPATDRAASIGLPDPAAVMRRLTAREREVAALLIRGLTYKRIALTLQARDGQPISEHTVRAHVGNIAWKLGVEENAKAGVMARIARLGLLFGDEAGG